MPVINGIKMACDACIRGHRSTKCDHGDSRVLMKVRKPGRPLTACPHLQSQHCDCPKNKGCGCSSSITVAFPKRQGCGDCKAGPKTMVKTEGKPAGPAIPDVPAATAGTFKVKKSTHLVAQIPRARPQSYDGSFFEGIDLNSVNIIQNGHAAALANTNGNGINGMALPPQQVHIAPALPDVHTQNAPQMPFYAGITANGQTPRTSLANGAGMPFSSADSEIAGFSLSNASYVNGNTDYMSNGRYLPSGHAQQPILTAPYAMSSAQSYTPSTNGNTAGTTVKSCCSSKTSLKSSPNSFATNRLSQVPIQQPYSTSVYSNGNSPIYNTAELQSAAYTYTGNFAAPQHQMQTGEWTQNFDLNYSQSPQALQQLQTSTGVFHLSESGLGGNFEMDCACGPDCQCFGCQSHPQNATTLAYVRNLNSQMSHQPKRQPDSPITPMQNQDPFYTLQNQPQPEAQIFQSHLLVNFYDSNLDKDPLVTTTAMKSETPDSLSRIESPQLSLNGSPFDSMGESQQQELDPNNFFIVDYQIDGECSGDVSGCQCGDDCQCLGCTIHQAEQERRQLEQESRMTKIGDGTVTSKEEPVRNSCCG